MLMYNWLKKLWVAELRSNRYEQCSSFLHTRGLVPGKIGEVDCYCGQGVLVHLAVGLGCPAKQSELRGYGNLDSTTTVITYDHQKGSLPPSVLAFAGIAHGDHPIEGVAPSFQQLAAVDKHLVALARLNDEGHTFQQLADYIEEHF
jgi:hypothetical protein